MIIRRWAGKGIFGGSVHRGGGVQWESKATYGVRNILGDQLSKGILSYCKDYCSLVGCR